MFPLFKSFSVVDLNIGYRLNNAYIPTTGLSDEEIADSVVHRIDGDVGFKEEEDVVELMTFASNELASRSARREAAEAIELYVASEDRDLLVSANESMRRLKIA